MLCIEDLCVCALKIEIVKIRFKHYGIVWILNVDRQQIKIHFSVKLSMRCLTRWAFLIENAVQISAQKPLITIVI